MRRKLFDWHVTLGKYAGVLIFIWALSGTVMTVQPLVLRRLDPGFPALRAEKLDLTAFRLAPARVASSAAAVALRQFHGRAWYEVAQADGSTLAFDARTGATTDAVLPSDLVLKDFTERLNGTKWTPEKISLVEKHTDQYRKGKLPVYEVAVTGPGAVILYISARDGGVELVTTRWSRLIRWLGLGIHTWNLAAVMERHDDERGLLLASLVALPLAAMAAIAYVLLILRRRAQARKDAALGARLRGPAAVAVATALALVLSSPGHAAVVEAAALSAASEARVVPLAPIMAKGLSLPSSAFPLAPALSAPRAVLAFPVSAPASASAAAATPAVSPLAAAVSVAAASPIAATPAAADAPVPTLAAPALARAAQPTNASRSESAESLSARAAAFFDGALSSPSQDDAPRGFGSSGPAALPAASAPASKTDAPPAAPRGPDRKALWALYATQVGHMISLSLVWRIAWPLFVLGRVGQAGLGVFGSFEQVSDVALGVVAGMVVDRLFPAKSMAAASLVRAGVGAAFAASALWWSPGAPFLLGLAMVHVFAMTVLYLGQAAASPAAVGGDVERLQKLNVALKLITTAVAIPGSYLGGWLVAKVGIPAAFFGYAVFNALVLAPMYARLLPKTAATRPEHAAPAGPRASLREVLRFLFTDKILVALLAATAAAMTFAEPLRNTILPILSKELLHGGALLLGHLMTAFYAGQTLGALALWRWSKKLAPRWWIAMSALGLSSFWLLALAPAHPAFLFIAVASMSLFTQPAATMIKTLFQREIADRRPELLGRALGLHLMFYAAVVGGETALLGWAFSALTGSFLAPILPLAAAYSALAAVLMVLVWTVLKKGAPK